MSVDGLDSEGVEEWPRKAYGSKGPFCADSSIDGRGFAFLGTCCLPKTGVCGGLLRFRLSICERSRGFCAGITTLGDLGRW